MIFLGFLIFAVLFLLSVAISATNFFVFVDVPSFLFILLGVAGYFLLFGRNEFGRGVKTFFAFSFPPDDNTHESGRFFLRLSRFTLTWGLLGVVIGIFLLMTNLNPDTLGYALAICLLSFLCASGLVLFVFLPIGLRLLPPTSQLTAFRQMAIRLLIFGLVGFVLMRFLVVIVLRNVLAEPAGLSALLAFNPADPKGDIFGSFGFHWILLFWDVPSLVLIVGSWWAFRLASGKRRSWIAAPVVILIGIFWSVQCFIFMLADFAPDLAGAGFAVAMLTTLFGFIAAAGFLIADIRHGFKDPPSLPPAEGTEQAKAIIDRAVESERR